MTSAFLMCVEARGRRVDQEEENKSYGRQVHVAKTQPDEMFSLKLISDFN